MISNKYDNRDQYLAAVAEGSVDEAAIYVRRTLRPIVRAQVIADVYNMLRLNPALLDENIVAEYVYKSSSLKTVRKLNK